MLPLPHLLANHVTPPNGAATPANSDPASTGTTVAQVTATDADDPMLGNNAKLIYSILQGEPYFSVEPKTGQTQRRLAFVRAGC